MAITNGYATLAELKQTDAVNITDTVSDDLLEQVIEAASRMIDGDCGRYFYQSATDETRYYTPEWPDKLFLHDDLVSITTLATDEAFDRTYATTWSASSDYELYPYNASTKGEPYTAIEVAPNGAYSFMARYRKSVKITGVFGWPSVPMAIKQACLQLSARVFKRLSTPLGVASMASMGEITVRIREKDPDYWHIIGPYKRKV